MMKLGRTIIVGILAGGLMAVGPGIAGNMGSLFNPEATPPRPSPVVTRSALTEHRPKLAAELAADFPTDFRQLSAKFDTIYAGSDQKGAAVAASKAVAELAQNYLTQIHQAPDADLMGIVTQMGALHALVLAHEGPKTCGAFSATGSGVLFSQGKAEPYLMALDTLSAAFFAAVARAEANPTTTLGPKDTDWALAAKQLLADGGSQSYIDVIAKGDAKSPKICPAMVALLQAATEVPGDAGKRLRAAFAVNAAAY